MTPSPQPQSGLLGGQTARNKGAARKRVGIITGSMARYAGPLQLSPRGVQGAEGAFTGPMPGRILPALTVSPGGAWLCAVIPSQPIRADIAILALANRVVRESRLCACAAQPQSARAQCGEEERKKNKPKHCVAVMQ